MRSFWVPFNRNGYIPKIDEALIQRRSLRGDRAIDRNKKHSKNIAMDPCKTGLLADMQFLPQKPILRMAWEKPYLEALIDHLRPQGAVLEVGFALGYAAAHIQTYHPRHHTIIEPDPVIAAKAIEWAKSYPSISVVQDTWEHALSKLGVFDSIFFDDLKPELEIERTQVVEAGNMAVQQGRKLIASIKMQFPEMMNIKYSDSDIDFLVSHEAQFEPHVMAKFLHELLRNNQISEEQYERVLSKYGLEKLVSTPLLAVKPAIDSVLVFLKACLKKHMRKGSRFSWVASSPMSKFESPEFFEAIITNPHVDYQETVIPVEVPATCEYYKEKVALIGVVEKQYD